MSLLSPPKSKYANFYEQEKFKLCWNLCVGVVLIYTALTTFYAVTGDEDFLPSLAGMLIGLVMLILQSSMRTYKIAAWFAFGASILVCQIDIFTLNGLHKIVDLSWMMSAGLFVFFTLGSAIGYLHNFINLAGFFLALLAQRENFMTIEYGDNFTLTMLDILLNVTVSILISAYLISKLIRSSTIAELSYRNANELLKQQNNLVQSQNAEKTVMLKEIHHRVKNNLQVITSLLRLQSKEITDIESINHFREAVNRVMAMALIHDRLYRSDDLSKIDLSGYLKNLADDLITSYSIEIPVTVEVHSEIDHIIPKSLVSVALLYNELISNSLKHGFSQVDEGKIRIELKQSGHDDVEMWYSDNGFWKNPVKEGSFGMELIDTLTTQLDGTYHLSTTDGTRYHFKFKLEGQLSAENP